jgi:two-component system cell cycle sensor histidine kinase/response regulator CckA
MSSGEENRDLGPPKSLKVSETRLGVFLQGAPDAIVGVDEEGQILFVNPRAEALFGYSSQELVGKSVEILVPERLRGAHATHRREFHSHPRNRLAGGGLELAARRKDGSAFPAEISLSPIRTSEGTLVTAVVRDLTERKRAEEALRESEAKYRGLVNEINDGVFATDEKGVLTFANRTLARIHGFEKPEDLLGRVFLELIAPSALNEVQDKFRAVMEEGKAIDVVTTRIVRQDGSEAVVEVKPTAIVVDGRTAGSRGVVRDITDRTRLEEQFRQAQKMEAVGRLAGGVAHDFNNILTAILGYSDLLLSGLPGVSPFRSDVEEIRKAAERAGALTRQLLAFSRRQILTPQILDLNSLVADMDSMLRRLLGEDVDLVTRLDPNLGHVRADPGQLEQVLANLSLNARDAMPEGGKLTIETRNVDLDASYLGLQARVVPGPYVLLSVSDTGVGMDGATQARLFEPFFTTKPKGKGTGLGLATVYGIVKQSDGYIWCQSELGSGTTFKVYLPRVAEEVEPVVTRPPLLPAFGAETVLLVEDASAVRSLVHRVLEEHGYAVLEAQTAEEALQLARRHPEPIQLLITDVVLPGASGRRLAEELLAERPQTKVLYMSGYTDDAIVHRGVLDPDTAFIHKPFTPEALARKVREVLDAVG